MEQHIDQPIRDLGLKGCAGLAPRCIARRATSLAFGVAYLQQRSLEACCVEAQLA